MSPEERKANQLGEFDGEVWFEAPLQHDAAPTLTVNVDRPCLATAHLPLLLCPSYVNEKYRAVAPFPGAEFIPMEHCWNLIFLPKEGVPFLRKLIRRFAATAGIP